MSRSETFEVLQVESELAQMVALYRERKPARVLEIGSWDGGTMRVWLTEAAPYAKIAAVDLNHRNSDAYEEWRRDDTELTWLVADSQTDHARAWILENGPFDWMFVDGDHGYAAVKSDVDACVAAAAPGAVILLHDITPPAGDPTYPPGVLLDEYAAAGFKTDRYQDLTPATWARGIGVIYL